MISTELLKAIEDNLAEAVKRTHTNLHGYVVGPPYHDRLDFPALIACPDIKAHRSALMGTGVALRYCEACSVGTTDSVCWLCYQETTKNRPIIWQLMEQRTDPTRSNHGHGQDDSDEFRVLLRETIDAQAS